MPLPDMFAAGWAKFQAFAQANSNVIRDEKVRELLLSSLNRPPQLALIFLATTLPRIQAEIAARKTKELLALLDVTLKMQGIELGDGFTLSQAHEDALYRYADFFMQCLREIK